MKGMKFLAVAMAAVTIGFCGAPAVVSNAAGLTQATSAEQVKYGKLTQEDTELLKGLFDFEYYKAQNPELVEVLGDNYDELFKHFCLCGIFEGRTCNPNFDPAAYASAYDDLKEQFGTDIIQYYKHYVTSAASENRTITTVEACYLNGITVEGLSTAEIKITPQVYKMSQQLGISDFSLVQQAVNTVNAYAARAAEGGVPQNTISRVAVQIANSTSEIRESEADPEAYAKAAALGKTGTISLGGNESYKTFYFVVRYTTGGNYAIYLEDNDDYFTEVSGTKLYATENYVEGENPQVFTSYSVRIRNISSSDEVSGSSSEYTHDFTEEPVLKTNYWHSGEYDYENNNQLTTDLDGGYVSAIGTNDSHQYTADNNISTTTTTARGYEYEVIGYYTNADGTDIHKFATEEEKAEWLETEAGSGSHFLDGYSEEFAVDDKGTKDTTYDVGANIEVDDNGLATKITIGISNEENQFGYVIEDNLEYTDYTETVVIPLINND